jgi:hypothetical protein
MSPVIPVAVAVTAALAAIGATVGGLVRHPAARRGGARPARRVRTGPRRRLDPLWVLAAAAAGLALLGGGVSVGRAVGPGAVAVRTVVVTPTVQPTTAAEQTSGVAGTRLATYGFELAAGYSAPLGPAAPTQSQVLAGDSGDIRAVPAPDGVLLQPGAAARMLVLSSGTTAPSFQTCATAVTSTASVLATPGLAVCLLTDDELVGIKVTGVHRTQPGESVTLQVVVWQAS